MQLQINEIKHNLDLINDLRNQHGLEKNTDSCGPLLFTAIASSDKIGKIAPLVERYFGPPHKAAGQGAFFKNLFDSFALAVGGMRKDQTYYRKDISNELTLYCAFWPWGSNPDKTSVRIELLYNGKSSPELFENELAETFS